MPHRLLLFALLIFLAGCLHGSPPSVTAPDVAAAFDPTDLVTCEAAGGRIGFIGMSGGRYCQASAPDAGQSCTRATDCSSHCMAQTRSCAPYISPPGCMEAIMREDGSEVLAVCAD